MFKLHTLKGKIIYTAKTDRGLRRNVNQDAIAAFTQEQLGLFVAADGMGGHSQGELASKALITEYQDYWEMLIEQPEIPEFDVIVEQIQEVLLKANRKIYEHYNQGQICGATAVILLIMGERYAIFSVGDSHIYSWVKRKYRLLTVDDIWDTQPSTVSNYTPEEIAANSKRGKLVQAVGTGPDINIHISMDRILKGQVFLLCSDGLYKFCEDSYLKRHLKRILSEKSMQETLDLFMKRVFENGAGDNVSVILVKVL